MYNGKYNDAGAVPLITLDNNKLSFNGGGCVVQGVGAEMFIYGQFGTTNQTKIQMGANMLIEAKSNRHITLKTGTLYFNNTSGLVGSVKSDVFIWGSSYNAIGSEGFSVQKDMLVKGSDNAAATSGFKVTDVNNNSLLDVKNNGRFATNGSNVNSSNNFSPDGTSANIFTVSYLDNILHLFNVQTFAIRNTAGTQDLLKFNVQSGVSKFILTTASNTEFFRISNDANCFLSTNLTLGQSTPVTGARFLIRNYGTNASQQSFFGNITMNTAGRLGSSGSFTTTQKGFECFDTDKNKKFFWNGSAWEKIKGNIESVTQATATTLTPNIDTSTMEILSSLAAALTIAAPTGTPHEGQELTFRFKDDGTARALTWNAIFEDYTGSLPTTTTAGKTVYIGCKYNLINTKWDVVAVQTQP